MFKKNLYITRGISENVPKELINTLWLKVQNVTNRKLDYLQVFNISRSVENGDTILKFEWSQEVPNHKEEFYAVGVDLPEDISKIWIICTGEGTNEEYSTMLLPEEY